MSYSDRFVLVEDYLAHVDPMMAAISDPFVRARYTGFIATSAVTAYELAIKDIFYAFADKKHVVLGDVTRARFSRLNGRIKLNELKDEHIKMFGARYKNRFERNIEKVENDFVRANNKSPKTAYNNVIVWRHQFVHEGTLPNTTNYAEIKEQYTAGKEVIHCLFRSMVR
jgi:glutathionyl-hydroquinone reductase